MRLGQSATRVVERVVESLGGFGNGGGEGEVCKDRSVGFAAGKYAIAGVGLGTARSVL